MTYIICEPCIGVKDRACVDECPVDCIYEGEDQLYIHPEECVDCDACLPACPVDAIYPGDNVPAEWKEYIVKNDNFFAQNPGASGGASEKRSKRHRFPVVGPRAEVMTGLLVGDRCQTCLS